ncbi:hypothetical protein AAVH_24656 [Aphelenchoides avenae]|nr:hypothetical protein AAVH_24656 [Aphelenchus avenae]
MSASSSSVGSGSSSSALLDGDAKLADTTLTAGWLVDILRVNDARFNEVIAGGKVDEVIAKDLSGQGEGYNSKVYRISLRLNGAKADDYSVIMKVPYSGDLEKLLNRINSAHTDEESAMSTDMFDPIAMHNVECAFYEATRGIEGFPIARVIYTHQVHSAKDMGVIILEDLGDEGVKLDYGFYQAQTAQQIKNVVRSYAALHAHQLCATGEVKARWDAVPCIAKMWHDAGVKIIMGVLPGLPECQNGGILKPLVDKIRPIMTVEFGQFSMIDRPAEIGKNNSTLSIGLYESSKHVLMLRMHALA